jgi:hypothetical protein
VAEVAKEAKGPKAAKEAKVYRQILRIGVGAGGI